MNRIFSLRPSVSLHLPVKHNLRPSQPIMPKASTSSASLPISGLFGLNKPSGPTSMHIVNQLKIVMSRSPLFFEPEKVEAGKGKQKGRRRRGKDMLKIGQGGTLDPLADGVLGKDFVAINGMLLIETDCLSRYVVIGVGKATKKLNDFLDCAKVRIPDLILRYSLMGSRPSAKHHYRSIPQLAC